MFLHPVYASFRASEELFNLPVKCFEQLAEGKSIRFNAGAPIFGIDSRPALPAEMPILIVVQSQCPLGRGFRNSPWFRNVRIQMMPAALPWASFFSENPVYGGTLKVPPTPDIRILTLRGKKPRSRQSSSSCNPAARPGAGS